MFDSLVKTTCAFRMEGGLKTQLVSAIHLQEVELQEKPESTKSSSSSSGEWNCLTGRP